MKKTSILILLALIAFGPMAWAQTTQSIYLSNDGYQTIEISETIETVSVFAYSTDFFVSGVTLIAPEECFLRLYGTITTGNLSIYWEGDNYSGSQGDFDFWVNANQIEIGVDGGQVNLNVNVDVFNPSRIDSEEKLLFYLNRGSSPLKLIADITLSNYLTIGQNSSQTVTIDLNDHTMQRTGLTGANANGHVIEVFGAGNLTLENGTITGGWANNGGGICNYGQLTLNNVTITGCKAVNGGGIMNNSESSLTINGGSITNCRSDAGGGAIVNHGTAHIEDCSLNSNIATTRGGAIWSDGDLYVYTSTITGNNALANGGDDQNEGDGGAIHLDGGDAHLFRTAITNNTSKDAGAIYVNSNTNLYIYGSEDTNTTISGNTSSQHGGGGIVNNGSVSLNGNISITGNTCHTNGGGIWNNGTLYIVGNVQVKNNTSDDIFLKNGKVIDISYPITSGANSIGVRMEKPGVFTNGYSSGMGQGYDNPFFPNANNIVIEQNGECALAYRYVTCSWEDNQLVHTIDTTREVVKLINASSTTLSGWNIAEGTFTVSDNVTCSGSEVHLILMDGANITFEKGLDVPHSSHLYIYSQSYNTAMGKLTATGESDAAGIGANEDHISGDITIHGGDITAQGGSDGAGIGGGNEEESSSGNITIYDGTIHATGGTRAAGIGSGDGNYNTFTVNIYGGYIVAQGGQDGAGIGGGEGVSCGIINIYGGTIRSTGGEYGAGIGEGELEGGNILYSMFDPGHSITIYGGDIVAKGGTYGAGIGGYNLPNYTTQNEIIIEITIYDGQVSAVGGQYGAGIGGSQTGNGANVTIHGGRVIANGGDDAAGIGSGEEGIYENIHGGTLTVTGGHVYAIGKMNGSGIGAGEDSDGANVTITGGTVIALGGLADPILGGGGNAFGSEDGDEHLGTLNLGNNMRVRYGTSETNLSFSLAADRKYNCWHNRCAVVEPCDHSHPADLTAEFDSLYFSSCQHCLVTNGSLPYTFQTTGLWNDASNWLGGFLPDSYKDIVVKAAATIPNGYTADVSRISIIEDGSITIEDGGQLKHRNTGLTVTMKKNITGYTGNGGYHLITNPTLDEKNFAYLGMLNNTYDLYYFDQSEELEWRNYKKYPFLFENSKGYLYANSMDKEIVFNGEVNRSILDINVPVTYDANAEFAGFNLIGNPFVCNAYILDENNVVMPFFKMSGDGHTLVAVQAGTAIKPCEGVFVICPNDGQEHSVVFTTTAHANLGEALDVPPMQIPVHELPLHQDASLNNTVTIDLQQGLNWWSTNLDITLDQLEEAIAGVLGTTGTATIKSQNSSISLTNGQWRPADMDFDIREMYQILVSSNCGITLTGLPVNPADYEITIQPGINWIGFLPSESMSIDDFFSGFNPEEGDVVKSSEGTASFNGEFWRGTIETLEPGHGYIYYSKATGNKTINFPR